MVYFNLQGLSLVSYLTTPGKSEAARMSNRHGSQHALFAKFGIKKDKKSIDQSLCTDNVYTYISYVHLVRVSIHFKNVLIRSFRFFFLFPFLNYVLVKSRVPRHLTLDLESLKFDYSTRISLVCIQTVVS